MSLRYTVYRTHDKSSDLLRRVFRRRAEDATAAAQELRRLLNAHFYLVLLRTPYSDLDVEKKGSCDIDAFARAFRGVASPPEVALVFRLVDDDGSGEVTYGKWQSFQKKYDPEPQRSDAERRGATHRKEGCPEFLEYGSLLDGLVMSCSRFPLMAKLEDANEPFPPSVHWLTTAMEAEWDNPKLRPHWVYATTPVPQREEGRRFPDWNGGFTVRDEGHVGMATEDFRRTTTALEAGLTLPEVVGLRLYTGPGYEALNLSLRANSQRFPATQYCIDSAIGKLAHVAAPRPLLRGMRKPMDPRWVRLYQIYRGVGHKRLALSDPGFVSTTTDVDVATGKDFGGPVLYALHALPPSTPLPDCGFLSNGGDVQWVSQYPGEAEILLPSNVILIPKLRCKHTRREELPLPPEKKVFEFLVFYPWDFGNNCPLVTQDFLACANALLDHVHGLDMAARQACRAGHLTGVPTFTLPRPLNPSDSLASSVDVVFTTPSCRGQTETLDDQPFHFLDPARKSLGWKRPPTQHSCEESLAECGIPYAKAPKAVLDYQLHIPAALLLLPRPEGPQGCPRRLSGGGAPAPPCHTEADDGPTLATAASLSLPSPQPAASSCGGTDGSFADSWYDPERAAHAVDSEPASTLSTVASSTDLSLAGSNAMRLATVRHYTQAEVDAALQRLRSKPVYDDGLDEVGLVGNDFPQVSSILIPFESSVWNIGLWGLILSSISGGLATLGIGGSAALGIAAAVTTTVVVATAVPLTVLHAPAPASAGGSVNSTGTPTGTPTMTGSATVTLTSTATASGTASTIYTQARTLSFTSTTTNTVTWTVTRTSSGTASHTSTATPRIPRTQSATPSATHTLTRTATQTSSNTASVAKTKSDSFTLTSTETRTRTRTLTPSETTSATASALRTRSVSSSLTSTPTRTTTGTGTGTTTESATSSGTDTPTGTVMRPNEKSHTPSPTATPTRSATHTTTSSSSRARTKTETPSDTSTPSRTLTLTPSRSASLTRTELRTLSATDTPTRTATRTSSGTASCTANLTQSPTRSTTVSPTRTATWTHGKTASVTSSTTRTRSLSDTNTQTWTRTASRTLSDTGTETRTRTSTRTASRTTTGSKTSSVTPSFSNTQTRVSTSVSTALLQVHVLSGTVDVVFQSTHNYTAGDSATVDVGVDLLEGVSLTASNLDGQGCPSATTFTSRTFTVALDNSTACSVPAGTPVRLSFAITALSTLLSQLVTFTLTTTRDPVPFIGNASVSTY